jgi:hypothetical protein
VNCDKLKELLGDFLDQELASEILKDVHVHLEACGPCSVEVDSLTKTILIYRNQTPGNALSDDARRRLFAVLSYEYQGRRRTDPA